jgi:hypothetical protein
MAKVIFKALLQGSCLLINVMKKHNKGKITYHLTKKMIGNRGLRMHFYKKNLKIQHK